MYNLKEGFEKYLASSGLMAELSEKAKLFLKHAWMEGAACVLKEYAQAYNQNQKTAPQVMQNLGKEAHAFDQYKAELLKQVKQKKIKSGKDIHDMPYKSKAHKASKADKHGKQSQYPEYDKKYKDPMMHTRYRISRSGVGGWGLGLGWGPGYGWGGYMGYPYMFDAYKGMRDIDYPTRYDDQRMYGKGLREKYPDVEAHYPGYADYKHPDPHYPYHDGPYKHGYDSRSPYDYHNASQAEYDQRMKEAQQRAQQHGYQQPGAHGHQQPPTQPGQQGMPPYDQR